MEQVVTLAILTFSWWALIMILALLGVLGITFVAFTFDDLGKARRR